MDEEGENRSVADLCLFEQQAGTPQPSVVQEIFAQLRHNRKWWLLPIIAGLLLVGGLLVVSSTAVAPFIYALF